MHLLTAAAALAALAEGKLLKVVTLARHGNRAPNPQVPVLCPNSEPMLVQFNEPVHARQRAALSRVGKAENWEAGRYLRRKYDDVLPTEYTDDGSVFFFSERMNRNIVSTEALLQGMFPLGSGIKGFVPERPNLVPILTSQPFEDTLINLPRDGPCKGRYNADRKKFNDAHNERLISQHRTLVDKFSAMCGFDLSTSMHSIGKSFAWSVKAAADAFSFAKNEGIDNTMGGAFDVETVNGIVGIAHGVTSAQRFGEKHQITYWAGRFPSDAVFANLRRPSGNAKKESLAVEGVKVKRGSPWMDSPEGWYERNKFLLFMNHREIFVALSNIFQLDELLKAPLPAGSMVVWEMHQDDRTGEEYLKIFSWKPSQPSFEEKAANVRHGNVSELYSYGQEQELFPGICKVAGRCTLDEFEHAYAEWTKETGTWEEVCGLQNSLEWLLAEQQIIADDGDDELGYNDMFERKVFGIKNFDAEAADRAQTTRAQAERFNSSLIGAAPAMLVGLAIGMFAGRRRREAAEVLNAPQYVAMDA